MTKVFDVPVKFISPGDNDRTVFDEQRLQELAENIAANGLAQPITVRPVSLGDIYEIVCGERRFRAIGLLGWETIPCIIQSLSDEEAASIMLAENVAREDLNPIDEARAYHRRMDKFGWSVADCAEKAGVSVSRVRERLKLLELALDVRELVAKGQLPLGHAAMVHKLDNNRQRLAVRAYRDTPMTQEEFRILVLKLYEQQVEEAAQPLFDLQQFVMQVKAQDESADPLAYVPVSDAVPDPNGAGRNGTIAVEQYIIDLLERGHEEAATAVGKVYRMWVLQKGYAPPGPHESPLRAWLRSQ